MGNLIESYLRTDHFTEAEELLTRYDEMIQDRERENEEQGTAFPVDRCRALMYVFFMRICMSFKTSPRKHWRLVEGDTDRRENRR